MFTLEFLKELSKRFIEDQITSCKLLYSYIQKWKHVFKIIPILGLIWFILFNLIGLFTLTFVLVPILIVFNLILSMLKLDIKHWFIKEK